MPKKPEQRGSRSSFSPEDLHAARAFMQQLEFDSRSPFTGVEPGSPGPGDFQGASLAIYNLAAFSDQKRPLPDAEVGRRSRRRVLLIGNADEPTTEKTPNYITSANAARAYRILEAAQSDPKVFPFLEKTNVLSALAEFRDTLAHDEQVQMQAAARQEWLTLERHRSNRRGFLRGVGVFGGAALAGGLFLFARNAIAQQQEADRKEQEKRKVEQARSEQSQLLTTTPSDSSANGWTVQAVPIENGVIYVESTNPKEKFSFGSGDRIHFGKNNPSNLDLQLNTEIYIGDHKLANGKHVVKFGVHLPHNKTEDKLLPLGSETGSVVLFRNTMTGKQELVRVNQENPNSHDSFTVTVVQRNVQ